MTAVVFTEVTRTCIACPSQWDLVSSDGRQWYGRYRNGYGTLHLAPNDDVDWDYPAGHFDTGDNGGALTIGEFVDLLGADWQLSPDIDRDDLPEGWS